MDQVRNGKAFEYALAFEMTKSLPGATLFDNPEYDVALRCYKESPESYRSQVDRAGAKAAFKLKDFEPVLVLGSGFKVFLQPDGIGKKGDVRDILVIETTTRTIGISVKHNHDAVKHSRLSGGFPGGDFGLNWFGDTCSTSYWQDVRPTFRDLSEMRNKKTKWSDVPNKALLYGTILLAFQTEFTRLCGKGLAAVMFRYLLGKQDYYKVVLRENGIHITPYNMDGSLGLPFRNKKPTIVAPALKMPTSLISMTPQGWTSLAAKFDQGWELSFRIHSASSRVEPSLKFDIQLIGSPHNNASVFEAI